MILISSGHVIIGICTTLSYINNYLNEIYTLGLAPSYSIHACNHQQKGGYIDEQIPVSMSFIYKKNIIDPKTVPCGTPDSTLLPLDFSGSEPCHGYPLMCV